MRKLSNYIIVLILLYLRLKSIKKNFVWMVH